MSGQIYVQFVYMLRDLRAVEPTYKIGIALHSGDRLKVLASEMKTELQLVRGFPFVYDIAPKIEAGWHQFFSRERIRHGNSGGCTEWFRLSDWDVRMYKKINFIFSRMDMGRMMARRGTDGWWRDVAKLDLHDLREQQLKKYWSRFVNPS